MPDNKRVTRSKQADLDDVAEGVQHKKQKQQVEPTSSNQQAKGKDKANKANKHLEQTTVDSLSEVKADTSDVKLVDPNTGEEVETKDPQPVKPNANKARSKTSSKMVNPNTGEEVKAATEQTGQPAATASKAPAPKAEPSSKPADKATAEHEVVKINRAPVLTLWVAVVAQHQGFSWEAGLTFGKAISGMLAQSKGRSIGVIGNKDDTVAAKEEKEEEEHKKGIAKHDVFGMSIKAKDVGDDGDVRATDTNMQVISHKSVEGYLSRAFKDQLQVARESLANLATSYKPEEIGDHCYHLYEQFRPNVAGGRQGWGQAGHLDLTQLHNMAENHSL